MSAADKWDRIYTGSTVNTSPSAARVLREYAYLLPARGQALDVACGMAGNALFLAGRGLQTRAWDISAVAIERVSEIARTRDIPLVAEVRDVCRQPPPRNAFDVIVVSRFLQRELCGSLMEALKPGGLLYYQTFIRERCGTDGPSNPDYRLARNELFGLFSDLTLRVYIECGRTGDCTRGIRDEAMLVGQRNDGS